MTFALVQLEAAALMRVVLRHSVPSTGNERAYLDFHSQLRREAWSHVEQTYLKHLDRSNPKQNLALDIAKLTFERIRLTQVQPVMRNRSQNQAMSTELESEYIQRTLVESLANG